MSVLRKAAPHICQGRRGILPIKSLVVLNLCLANRVVILLGVIKGAPLLLNLVESFLILALPNVL